jgi:CRISPR system Cascade subunit CasA
MMDNRFNLIDEPWVPVADRGLVSLRDVFSRSDLRSVGGNPMQKIALLKFLQAIAQAAATPPDEVAWQALGEEGLAQRCLAYLERWHARFFLYGEQPFLQMPAIVTAERESLGAVLPEVSTGNTPVLSQIHIERPLGDADKALLLLTLMGLALAGKKTDNSVVLTLGYTGKRNAKGKPSSGRAGPSVGHYGFLHTFLLGESLRQTLWLNLFTDLQIRQRAIYSEGLGTPPWESMPAGEDCPVARRLRDSLLGRLVPLSRFCLFVGDGLCYSEGIAHQGYKEGVIDPSISVDWSGKQPRALWVDPEKRPWRELTALLGFIEPGKRTGFENMQLQACVERARDVTTTFAVWAGGLRVSSTAGEQFVGGGDDFVESLIWIDSSLLGEVWFSQLKHEMDALDQLSRTLYGRVNAFFKEQKVDGGKLAAQATRMYWQLCERDFQGLVGACGASGEAVARRQRLRRRFAGYVHQAFDHYCPRETARQLDAWAKCRPNNSAYLQQEA